MIDRQEMRQHTCSAPDLSHDPLQRIVGADLLPVNVWKGIVGQGLVDSLLDESAALLILPARKSSMIALAFWSAASRLSCA